MLFCPASSLVEGDGKGAQGISDLLVYMKCGGKGEGASYEGVIGDQTNMK